MLYPEGGESPVSELWYFPCGPTHVTESRILPMLEVRAVGASLGGSRKIPGHSLRGWEPSVWRLLFNGRGWLYGLWTCCDVGVSIVTFLRLRKTAQLIFYSYFTNSHQQGHEACIACFTCGVSECSGKIRTT